MPESLRDQLKIPLGNLIKNDDPEKTEKIQKAYSEKTVITIGDATTELLIKMGLIPFLQIIDGKEQRHDREIPIDDSSVTKLNCVNRPGELSEQSIEQIKRSFSSEPPIRILVDGEEDLLVLPACLFAPENFVIMYGQPNEGIVIVDITSEIREKVQKIVNSMK